MSGETVQHGGDLGAARAMFPHVSAPWLDLSTGVNAIAYPIGEISAEAFGRLPGSDAIGRLEAAAGAAYGAPGPRVVAAPGTQALIQILPRVLPARSVAILGFTYAEHGRVWRESGARTEVVDDPAALARADVAVVVNPNNPDGRLVPVETLAEIAASMARRGGTLVVDEAFMDVLPPRASVAPRSSGEGIVVLRSFGKAYGLAGLRLGFAIGSPECAARLRSALGPWAVSGPAAEIGARALADRDWLAQTRERLDADAARLDALLTRAGFDVIGGTPLFRLASSARTPRVFEVLGEAGILVRRFPERANWLRFGIPGAPPDWARLEAALMALKFRRPPETGRIETPPTQARARCS